MDSIVDLGEMNRHRSSYRKTIGAALLTAVGCGVIAIYAPTLASPSRQILAFTLFAAGLGAILVSIGGLLVLYRHACDMNGERDPFLAAFSRRPRDNSRGWRGWILPLFAGAPRRGDWVRVRDAAEIHATLDDRGTLDQLPFMPEMLAYCGRTFVVDRRIDKINDWIAHNDIRRMKNVVTLVDVRCSGAQHGGCQAGCQILWNERWLQRVADARRSSAAPSSMMPSASTDAALVPKEFSAFLMAAAQRRPTGQDAGNPRYTCQITELPRASAAMSKWDIRQDLRPLLNGNLSVSAFLIAMLTAIFNAAQALRGGVPYPVPARQLDQGPTPVAQLDLQPGEIVRVRSKYEIGLTLFRNHNRGMWFGRETQRHCGRQYAVLRRVDRIIDERSGELKQMKTPVVALQNVTATGEFLRFCPQNEYVFWREIWLERVDRRAAARLQASQR